MGIKYTLKDYSINGLYGAYIDTDIVNSGKVFQRYINELCNEIAKNAMNTRYGIKSNYNKENKTMTNFQWVMGSDIRKEEFLNDIKTIPFSDWYRKYGINRKNETIYADVFEWLISEYKPPKTECIDLYKLIKFANNPALFNLDESAKITSELYKLDRYLYCKDVENDSYVVKRSNAFDIIISNTRLARKSLIETEFDKLPKSTFNLSEASYSGRYMRA